MVFDVIFFLRLMWYQGGDRLCSRVYMIRVWYGFELHRSDRSSIPTQWSEYFRAAIFFICMIYLMLPGGSLIICMIYSSTCVLGWICTEPAQHVIPAGQDPDVMMCCAAFRYNSCFFLCVSYDTKGESACAPVYRWYEYGFSTLGISSRRCFLLVFRVFVLYHR